MRICIDCETVLKEGVNWYSCLKNKGFYICNHCNKERAAKIYKKYREKYIKNAIVRNRTKQSKQYMIEYRIKNKTNIRNKERLYKNKKPWVICLTGINQRCTNPKRNSYRYYGAKGIKNYLSSSDIKFLWYRDKADLLKKPSIDRVDSEKDYTLKNCRFIELSENVGRAQKRRKDGLQ
jgi:hypothetical protein